LAYSLGYHRFLSYYGPVHEKSEFLSLRKDFKVFNKDYLEAGVGIAVFKKTYVIKDPKETRSEFNMFETYQTLGPLFKLAIVFKDNGALFCQGNWLTMLSPAGFSGLLTLATARTQVLELALGFRF
jgi:hypothetical protein